MSFRVDNALKRNFDQLCDDFGVSSSAAFTIFMKAVVRERKIPFEIKADPDPFYSEENMRVLRERAAAIRSGKAKLKEHGLIQGKR